MSIPTLMVRFPQIISSPLSSEVPQKHLGPADRRALLSLESRVMRETASDLARRLARDAEAVCRHYLSNGRRQGRYWLVGDVANTPGRSLFVRLRGADSGKGAAGKWTDAATGEHGDLLDIIRETCGLTEFRDVLDEARRFLCLPRTEPLKHQTSAPQGSPESARRLFAIGRPIRGTLAETYLRRRGVTDLSGTGALRFHPRCYYRADEHATLETWPALLAAVTDLDGSITGLQRTWLARDGSGKAPLAAPRCGAPSCSAQPPAAKGTAKSSMAGRGWGMSSILAVLPRGGKRAGRWSRCPRGASDLRAPRE